MVSVKARYRSQLGFERHARPEIVAGRDADSRPGVVVRAAKILAGCTYGPATLKVIIYAQGLMTKMSVRHLQGEPMEKTLAWAETEVEGFMRI